jgi:hypothetical protein
MDIRLITVREDFEKAFSLLDQNNYPLSFYEYILKHDQFQTEAALKLIGIFEEEKCIGTISYRVSKYSELDRILDIKEIYQTGIKGYKALIDFVDQLAKEENCQVIKISKKKVERLNISIFDRMEDYLKNIIFPNSYKVL